MSEVYGMFDGPSYGQSFLTEMLGNTFSDGIVRGGKIADAAANDLALTPGSGLSVSMNTGCALIRGFFYQNTAAKTITLTAAHATLPRIDSIVLKLDSSAKTIAALKVDGTANASPVAPTLTNSSTVKYLKLADVHVSATVTSLNSGDITSYKPYCGAALPYTPISHEGDTDQATNARAFIGSQGMISGAIFYRYDGLGTPSEFGFGVGNSAGDYGFYTETPNANLTNTTIEAHNWLRNARWDGSQYVFIATGRKAALMWLDNSGLHIMHSTDGSPTAGNPVTWSGTTHLSSW